MTQGNFFQHLFNRKNPALLATEEAVALMELKQYDAAANVLLTRALVYEPGDRRALLHLGVLRMLQENFDEAEEILRSVAAEPAEGMDSEKAAAQIALERVAALRAERREEGSA